MSDQRSRAILEVQYPGGPVYVLDTVERFTYSSDVLAVGDECVFELTADQQGETLAKLRMGSTLRLYMINPAVNGGARTLKHYGIITDRSVSLKQEVIRVTSADLGWLLKNCAAPLFRSLRSATFGDLVDPKSLHTFIDKTHPFKGVRIDDSNLLQRSLKLGKVVAVAAQNNLIEPVYAIQIEAGDSAFDVMSKYAQRFNRLIGVTVDGYIQVWNPDYNRPPAYHLHIDRDNTAVIDCEQHDTIATLYTDVVCVGEVATPDPLKDPQSVNAGKRRGAIYHRGALPFHRLHTFGDGEMWNAAMAQKMAEWKYKRGVYDSHYLAVTVADHYQAGVWFESDQMIRVTAPALGLKAAPYYVGSCVCEAQKDTDVTTLNLRLPGFLSASFGEWKSPPVARAEIQSLYQETPAAQVAAGAK